MLLCIIYMKSSYKNNINYDEIFKLICLLNNPKNIVEIGILDGYSLMSFCNNSSYNCKITAYDIFDKFNGNSANKSKIIELFKNNQNVKIEYGDYYEVVDIIKDDSIDILHIDIANDGDVYEFAFNNYIKKMKKNSVIILEGGTQERDHVEWMIKYNKSKIVPIIEKYKNKYNIKTIGNIPGITVVKL